MVGVRQMQQAEEVEAGITGMIQHMGKEALQQVQQAGEEVGIAVMTQQMGEEVLQQMQQAGEETGILAKEKVTNPNVRMSLRFLEVIVLGTAEQNPSIEEIKDGVVCQHLVVDGMMWT
jgi:hypothetical protein